MQISHVAGRKQSSDTVKDVIHNKTILTKQDLQVNMAYTAKSGWMKSHKAQRSVAINYKHDTIAKKRGIIAITAKKPTGVYRFFNKSGKQ